VRAKDAAGNVDGSPASYAWTVQADCISATHTAAAAADAWVDQGSPAQNKGTDSVLKVMSKGPSNNVRAMVRFALPSMPAGCAVTSAKLRLYAGSFKDGRSLEARRLTGSWNEGAVTWDNQPATASGTGVGTSATTPSGAGYREWDVRWMAQAMYQEGNNGFLIRDANENNDSEQQLYSREKGESPPQLVLTFGPKDSTPPQTTVDSGPDATTTSTSAQLRFSADQEGSTFECSRDGAPFTACTSPVDYTNLALGDHELRVRATDPAGNVDTTPASFTWRVIADTVAPQTTIGTPPGGAPPATTTDKNATFTFTSDDQTATFECSLDGGTFNACSSPKQYTNLANGAHSFRVRAKDPAGNTGPAASYFWTIEAPPTPTCTASTVTAAANADAWVLQSSAGSNFGTDSVLKVDSKSGNANARALVRFGLPQVPAGCRVTGSTLRLHSASYKEGRTLQALRLGGSWTESGVKWSSQPATTGSAATAPSRSGSAGYVEWNVLSHVPSMYSGSNNGFLIRDAAENGGGFDQAFNSREKGADNPPQLVVTFG
jgi:hypothetical protein